MDFLSTVQRDLQTITTTDFATHITITPPGGTPVIVPGYAGKHSIDVDQIGFRTINSKKAHCSIMEQELLKAGYTTRVSTDANADLITFEKHTVSWKDVSGQTRTYIVQQGGSKPNETVGLIVFILGYFKPQP